MCRAAPELAKQGERTMSTDELTGMQALERKHPGLPMTPGKVERVEFEYIRHGTCSFILSRDVVTGQVVAPTCGPTRTEADFLAHARTVVASDPLTHRWHFVTDNLDIHRSASLVRWVAQESDLDIDLGVKGKSGVLKNRQSRAAFLSDPSHRIVSVIRLYAEALLLVEPDRDLAEHLGAQAAQAWLLHFGRTSEGQSAGVHRLLQSHDGQAVQVDLHGQAPHGVTIGVFKPVCTSYFRRLPIIASNWATISNARRSCAASVESHMSAAE